MKEQLIALLEIAFGISNEAATQMYEERIAPDIQNDDELAAILDIFSEFIELNRQAASSTGPIPDDVQAALDVINQEIGDDIRELNQWRDQNIDPTSQELLPKREVFNRRYDKVLDKEFGRRTGQENSILTGIFRDIYPEFATTGLPDEQFEEWALEQVDNRLLVLQETERVQRVEERDRRFTISRIEQAAEQAADEMLGPVEELDAGQLDTRTELVENIKATLAQRLEAGEDLGLDTVQGFSRAVDLGRKLINDYNVVPDTGFGLDIEGARIRAATRARQEQLAQQGSGLPSQQFQSLAGPSIDTQGHILRNTNLTPDLQAFVSGITDDAFADFIVGQQFNLENAFRQSEQQKLAGKRTAIEQQASAAAAAGIPITSPAQFQTGAFAPMTFADYLKGQSSQLQTQFQTEQAKQQAQQAEAERAQRRRTKRAPIVTLR